MKNQDFISAFGNHLKALRIEKKLSQEDLASKCEMALSQIGRFERGVRSPTLSSLASLAKGLEIHPKELLDF